MKVYYDADVTRVQELILEALRQGKDVVTANKALLAEHGRVLFGEGESILDVSLTEVTEI